MKRTVWLLLLLLIPFVVTAQMIHYDSEHYRITTDVSESFAREVAAKTNTTLVDLRKVFLAHLEKHNTLQADGAYKRKGVLTYDGVHLLPAGNALLADHLSRGITAALRREAE